MPPVSSDLGDRQARLIIDNAVDYAIVGLDPTGVITSWNVGAERIMEWTPGEAIGQHVSLFFTPEDIEARIPNAEMSAAVEHGRGIDERWHLRKDGSRFWANGEMMPLYARNGDAEGYVKILRDQTAQHYADVTFVENEERYRALSDAIDEGFCIIEVCFDDEARPTDYRFLEVNAAFERQTGLIDAAGKWMRDIAPEHEQHWFDTYAKVALTGEPTRFALPAQALNGRWYEVFAYRIGDPADRQVAVLFSDITQRRTSDARLKASEENLLTVNATLRESEARLAALVRGSSEVRYSMNPDWSEMRQLSGSGFLADTTSANANWLDEYIHPDDQPVVREAIEQAITTSTAFRFEHRVRLADGSLGWTSSRAVPILDADGGVIEWFGAASDVTEQRRAEAELRRAERLRTALAELSDRLRDQSDPGTISSVAGEIVGETLGANLVGYGLVDADDETITVEDDWTAPGAVSLKGVAHFRDYGVYIDDLKAVRTVVVSDAYTDPRTREFADALAERSAVAFVNTPIQEQGAFVALLYVSQAHARDWSEDELSFIREVAARVRSAAERARSDQALKELNTHLEAEVEARTAERDNFWRLSRDPFMVADAQGVWRQVSPAWTDLLGWREDELVGRTSEWMEHPDDKGMTRAEVARIAGGTTTLRFENRFRSKDGEYRWFSWTAVPAEHELMYCVARDVTDAKLQAAALAATEEQLRQSQKMEAVGQLTGGLAHDFNNLLTAVTGGIELLAARVAKGEYDKLDRYITMAQTGANRAAALTQRLLAFSRRQTLAPTPTDADRLIAGMEEIIDRTTGPAVETNVVSTAGLWSILVDAPQLENALLNLCINARDAMPDGGTLTIETCNKQLDHRSAAEQDVPEGEYVLLCVTDTGTGMPPEIIERVFDPFFTTKPLGEGTGLGLSMIYGFVRQSGGQIRIQSEVGQGTTMCLYLPRYMGEVDPETNIGTRNEPQRAAAGEMVLIVEDEAAIRQLMTEILEDAGYQVLEAPNGPAGVKVMQSDVRIDLLITDVGLPGGLNGRQVADAGRAVRPGLKVLFVTGYAANAAVGAGHMAEGMELLTKPFNVAELEARVHAMVAGSIFNSALRASL